MSRSSNLRSCLRSDRKHDNNKRANSLILFDKTVSKRWEQEKIFQPQNAFCQFFACQTLLFWGLEIKCRTPAPQFWCRRLYYKIFLLLRLKSDSWTASINFLNVFVCWRLNERWCMACWCQSLTLPKWRWPQTSLNKHSHRSHKIFRENSRPSFSFQKLEKTCSHTFKHHCTWQ